MLSRELRYFLAVAEHGGFAAAALRIGVAQPALSVQVAKLEAMLGCRLFERHARGVTLTRAGQHLRSEVLEIADQLDRTERETRFIGQSRPTVCTIGLPPRAADALAVPLVAEASDVLPQVSLHILDAMGGILREWYAEDRLDLAVLYRLPGEPLGESTPLITEQFYVAASRRSGFKLVHEIDVDELLTIPLIVSSGRNAHRQLLEAVARRRGKSLRVAGEIDSVNAQRKLVMLGVGAAVLPCGDFAAWPTEDLDVVPVRGEELMARLLVVSGRKMRDSPIVDVLTRMVQQLVHRLVADGSWRGARIAGAPND